MRNQDIFAVALVGLGLGWASASAWAQQAASPPASSDPPPSSAPANTSPSKDGNKDKSKTPAKPTAPSDASDVDAPTPQPGAASQAPATPQASSTPQAPATKAADDNAFPEDTSKQAAQSAQAPAKKTSTADDNPFPEDVSAKAAADAKAAGTDGSTPDVSAPAASDEAAPRSAEGSSSLDTSTRRVLTVDADPKRANDDVRVGKYYMKSHDYKGAYDRFKDAETFDHENAEAVFWLAEAARKMNLDKEAAQNYQVYLEAVPDGPNSKAARKALGEIASTAKP